MTTDARSSQLEDLETSLLSTLYVLERGPTSS
jgi:hypothetical protein